MNFVKLPSTKIEGRNVQLSSQLLKSVLAKNGDKTIPPLTAAQAGTGRFSQEEGWRVINSTPDADGGVAPMREDFNGVANLLSQFIVWYQQGGIMQWNSQLTYEVGNEIMYNGVKYRCKQTCTNEPPPNKTYWHNLDNNIPAGMYAFFKIAGIQNKHPIFLGETTPDTSWVLADGTNGTEDLRNKFIYGGDSATTTTGGAESVTLAVANMPTHSHTVSTSWSGAHQHERGSMDITGGWSQGDDGVALSSYGAFYAGGSSGGGAQNDSVGRRMEFRASRTWSGATTENGSHTHTVTINNTGSGQAFSILPPYIKKAWFMKVAE